LADLRVVLDVARGVGDGVSMAEPAVVIFASSSRTPAHARIVWTLQQVDRLLGFDLQLVERPAFAELTATTNEALRADRHCGTMFYEVHQV